METYSTFGEKVKETKRKLLEFLIRGQAGGETDRRLRRARQGQYAAELLRHPDGFPRLHGGSQSVQAGQVPARHAYPDLSPGQDSGDETGLRADSALEFQRRDHETDGGHSRVGRKIRRADPDGGGHRREPAWKPRNYRYESGSILRRHGDADAGIFGGHSQADGADRLPAHPLARHEVLRPLTATRISFSAWATRPTSSRITSSNTTSASRTTSSFPRAARTSNC